MRRLKQILILSMIMLTTTTYAVDVGRVNFNLGESPVADSPVQPVTLYGCDKVVNSDLFWGSDNQMVGNIPYGWHQSEVGKRHYISKYYIASPPVFRKGTEPSSPKQKPYIGLVTPDSFTYKGKKPVQIVYFDYRILKPTYLTFVPINYEHKNRNGESCASLGVDLIPVNTQCGDFPWRNGSLGAAGIGEITYKSNRVFLPLTDQGNKPLNCKVSVLDDILLHHDIYFLDKNGEKKKTASLTYHHNHLEAIKLVCFKRPKDARPEGCSPP